mmetsp:Transcript_32496/g.74255  ORF Transcript_32496/g.74255 Transcript_32496/m.74255 type:complete len:137 (-) Transcript_32496:52-462(-)
MRSLSAAVSGAIAMHVLANFLTAPLALAGWCWAATGNAGSIYGCVDAASLGMGACSVAEDCCDGYTCHIGGQCVGGATDDDSDGPNGLNTRTPGLAGSDACNATTVTTTGANVSSAFQSWALLIPVACGVFTIFRL